MTTWVQWLCCKTTVLWYCSCWLLLSYTQSTNLQTVQPAGFPLEVACDFDSIAGADMHHRIKAAN
jgi:hypothetical protein